MRHLFPKSFRPCGRIADSEHYAPLDIQRFSKVILDRKRPVDGPRPLLLGALEVLDTARIDKNLERLKWYLWHGNVYQALKRIECLEWDLEDWQEDSEPAVKLLTAVQEFGHYIEVNRNAIPHYGDRYQPGEMISTSFVESAVNQIVSKRMVKSQQMRWTKPGAHLLLQIRAHACDPTPYLHLSL